MMNEQELNEARKLIAGYLKQRREELKLTQQELADKVGMSRETISRMEASKFWLGLKQLTLICEALNITLELKIN
jgi:transcriptional regulator with XRE-family HTH domain